MTMIACSTALQAAEDLRRECRGIVHLPGDAGYDEAVAPWNVAVAQRPAAVALPTDAEQVAEVVRAAARLGLRVAAQGTGHNAGPLGPLDDVVLVRTGGMRRVSVDPVVGRATAQAGALWLDVVEEAAGAGVTVLHGSSPDVGVVGYSLGGGMGWYARALGLQASSITAAEVVTADGRRVHTCDEHEPEIVWALRGGGGNVGIVTELAFRTYPFTTAYAGMLVWDASRAQEVLPVWARWAADAPDEVTTSGRVLHLPPLPELPEPLRGRSLFVVDGAVLAEDEEAAAVLAPLRALQPEIDTFSRVPTASLVRLHMDPEGPTPAVSATALLAELPQEAVDAFLEAVGTGSGSTLLAGELRQLGGALSRPSAVDGAVRGVPGAFLLFGVAVAATPGMAEDGRRDAERLVEALRPWHNGRDYLNVVEEPADVARGYEPAAYERLRAVRAALDPTGLFLANHEVRPAHVPARP